MQLNSITQNVPSALDTVILTGFSANTSFVSFLSRLQTKTEAMAQVPIYLTSTAYETASMVQPDRFPESLPNGYLITATPYTNQLNFAFVRSTVNAQLKIRVLKLSSGPTTLWKRSTLLERPNSQSLKVSYSRMSCSGV